MRRDERAEEGSKRDLEKQHSLVLRSSRALISERVSVNELNVLKGRQATRRASNRVAVQTFVFGCSKSLGGYRDLLIGQLAITQAIITVPSTE